MSNMYYMTGWLDPLHAIDRRRTPIEFFAASKKMMQTHYKEMCYKAEDPRLIRIFWVRGFRKIDVTKHFTFKEFNDIIKDRINEELESNKVSQTS